MSFVLCLLCCDMSPRHVIWCSETTCLLKISATKNNAELQSLQEWLWRPQEWNCKKRQSTKSEHVALFVLHMSVLGRSRGTISQNGKASGTLWHTVHSTDQREAHLVLEDSWLLNSLGSDEKMWAHHELAYRHQFRFTTLWLYHYNNSVFSTCTTNVTIKPYSQHTILRET